MGNIWTRLKKLSIEIENQHKIQRRRGRRRDNCPNFEKLGASYVFAPPHFCKNLRKKLDFLAWKQNNIQELKGMLWNLYFCLTFRSTTKTFTTPTPPKHPPLPVHSYAAACSKQDSRRKQNVLITYNKSYNFRRRENLFALDSLCTL